MYVNIYIHTHTYTHRERDIYISVSISFYEVSENTLEAELFFYSFLFYLTFIVFFP